MEFWLGELNRSYLKDLEHEKIMDSAVSFIPKTVNMDVDNYIVPKIPYKYKELFLDNGAFSLLKNSSRENDNKYIKTMEKFVLKTQQELKPKYTVPFDYPFSPGMTTLKMQKEWEKTKKNIQVWESECSSVQKLIPAVHAWNVTSLKENMQWVFKKDYDSIAVGSLLTLDVNLKGFFGDRQPNKNLFDSLLLSKEIASEYGFKIHVFGLGSSPLMYHLANYCGIDSSDSSGYRRKAAYGKIILPQTGERYAGNGTARFGYNYKKGFRFSNIFSDDEKSLLKNCQCPVCSAIKKDPYQKWLHLRTNWELRAIHNKWVMDQEVNLGKMYRSKDPEEYERFLDEKFKKSRFNNLWEYVKKRKREQLK